MVRPRCEHNLIYHGHHPTPMVKHGWKRGRQQWRCTVRRAATLTRWRSTNWRSVLDSHGRYERKQSAGRIAAAKAEIAAIQKRIRDAN